MSPSGFASCHWPCCPVEVSRLTDRLCCAPQTDVFLLCYAVNSANSFSNISVKWLPELKEHCPSATIILVGTLVQRHFRDIFTVLITWTSYGKIADKLHYFASINLRHTAILWTPPQVFRRYIKTATCSAAVFGTPVHASFPHMWKFRTQVTQGQVTKSRQVTSLQKSLNDRHSYADWPISLKLLGIDIRKRYL